jgi:hypothetical protein
MHTHKSRLCLFVLIIAALTLTACGPGQMFGPTITPTFTFTPIPPTATATPSFTPTPVFTPTPAITATPAPSCTAKNGEWKGHWIGKWENRSVLLTVEDCFIVVIVFGAGGGIYAAKANAPIIDDAFVLDQSNSFLSVPARFEGAFSSPTTCEGSFSLNGEQADWEATWTEE